MPPVTISVNSTSLCIATLRKIAISYPLVQQFSKYDLHISGSITIWELVRSADFPTNPQRL